MKIPSFFIGALVFVNLMPGVSESIQTPDQFDEVNARLGSEVELGDEVNQGDIQEIRDFLSALKAKDGILGLSWLRVISSKEWLLYAFRDAISRKISYDSPNIVQWYELKRGVLGKGGRPYTSVAKVFRDKLFYTHGLLQMGLVSNRDIPNVYTKLRDYWIETPLLAKEDDFFIRQYRMNLDDIRAKFEFYLSNREFENAKCLLRYLPANVKRLKEREIFLYQNPKHIPSFVGREKDVGLPIKLRYIRNLLKADQNVEALHAISTLSDVRRNFRQYWSVCAIAARQALLIHRYQGAYKVVSKYLADYYAAKDKYDGTDLNITAVEAEWLAGFLALEFLRNSQMAIPHLIKMHDAGRYPGTKAQALYWMAIAYKKAKEFGKQEESLRALSAYPGTFYYYIAQTDGQHASNKGKDHSREKGGYSYSRLFKDLGTKVVDENVKRATDAALFLYHNGGKEYSENLLDYIALYDLKTEEVQKIIDHLFMKSAVPLGILLSKKAANGGYGFIDTKIPPDFIDLGGVKPRVLDLAIIRQESSFDQNIVSAAGAIGLMQIMPATAKAVSAKHAGDLQIPSPISLQDPRVNTSLGMAYCKDLALEFKSNVLALAAYNAGKRNAYRFIKKHGDPTSMTQTHDIARWIELVDFSETRLYIKKVLENLWSYQLLIDNKYDIRALKKVEISGEKG